MPGRALSRQRADLHVRKPTKPAIATHVRAALAAPSDVTDATFDGTLVPAAHVKPKLDPHQIDTLQDL